MARKFLSAVLVLLMVFGIATSAMAAEKENDKAKQQFMEEVAKLQPFMKIDDDGFFQMSARSAKEVGVSAQTFAAVKSQFSEINGELKKMSKNERLEMFKTGKDAVKDGGAHTQSCGWVYVPK